MSVVKLKRFIDLAYRPRPLRSSLVVDLVKETLPPQDHAALLLLPTSYLSARPLWDLCRGFEEDIQFVIGPDRFPIRTEQALTTYAAYVAGTVARLCIELVYHHTYTFSSQQEREDILQAGDQMGIALQLVNIARDIPTDAKMGRCYIPTTWLREKGLEPADVIKDPTGFHIEALRQRLLDRATTLYRRAKPAIEKLPPEARGPMRVAVESYMEIGRVLRTPGYQVKRGRATVPKWRRVQVAWRALNER